jgi:hypothetical protein
MKVFGSANPYAPLAYGHHSASQKSAASGDEVVPETALWVYPLYELLSQGNGHAWIGIDPKSPARQKKRSVGNHVKPVFTPNRDKIPP